MEVMTLEEAIKHAEEVANSKEKQVSNGDWEKGSMTERDCIECAADHRQLAEWLKELKASRQILEGYGLYYHDGRFYSKRLHEELFVNKEEV